MAKEGKASGRCYPEIRLQEDVGMDDGRSIRSDVVRFTNEMVRVVVLQSTHAWPDAFSQECAKMAELRPFFSLQLPQAAAPCRRSRLEIFALVCAANLGLLAAAALGWSGLPVLPVLIGLLSIGALIGLGWEEVAAEIDALVDDDDHPNAG
jgi:hypothetical protein